MAFIETTLKNSAKPIRIMLKQSLPFKRDLFYSKCNYQI